MTARLEIALVHDEGVDLTAPAVERRAVRAVVLRDREVLLLETADGALKFPGGGVEPGETDEAALVREIEEECGLLLVEVLGDLGEVRESAAALEEDPFDVFTMVSRYLLCSLGPGTGVQRLTAGESALGLVPGWVDVDDAVRRNEAVLATGPRWVQRELAVLRVLATSG